MLPRRFCPKQTLNIIEAAMRQSVKPTQLYRCVVFVELSQSLIDFCVVPQEVIPSSPQRGICCL